MLRLKAEACEMGVNQTRRRKNKQAEVVITPAADAVDSSSETSTLLKAMQSRGLEPLPRNPD